MPKKQSLRFPTREERQSLLKTLKELDPQGLNGEKYAQYYREYLQAIQALDQRMGQASAEDPETELPRSLTEADKQTLLQSLADTAKAGETLIAYAVGLVRQKRQEEKANRENNIINTNPINDPPAEQLEQRQKWPEEIMAETVNQLQSLAAKDFGALSAYDPETPKSLPELQADARTQTIDLRGRKLGTVGNQQNSRIKMKLVNGKGEKINGFFTRATHVDTFATYQEIIRKAKEKCTDQKDLDRLDNLLKNYRSFFRNRLLIGMPGYVNNRVEPHVLLGHMLHLLYLRFGDEGTLGPKELDDPTLFGGLFAGLPKEALTELGKGLADMKNASSYEMSALNLGLPDKTRLDNRNSATSCVAELLKIPHLVAKSVNMKFIGEDGKVTEGSFMEHAQGIDLFQKPGLLKHIVDDPFSDPTTRGNLFKQIADLQVLDYICMNQDRHWGNLFYEVNQQGQITGIQAIDNDSSFARANQFSNKAAEMMYISKSMVDRLEQLTPEMLRFALRGQGLSELELEAAGKRLDKLKTAIREQEVRVLGDEKFGEKTMADMTEGKNLFMAVSTSVKQRKAACAKHSFTPLPVQNGPDFKEVGTNARKMTVGGLKDALGSVSRLVYDGDDGFNVDKLTTFFRGSSPAFKDLVRAAKDADALRKSLDQDPSLRDDRFITEKAAGNTLKSVTDAFAALQKTAIDYLQYKAGPQGDPSTVHSRNPYTQAHIDYARSILQTVEIFKENTQVMTKEDDALVQDAVNRKLQNEIQEEKNPLKLNLSF